MLTFLPMEQINEMSAWEGSQLNRAKEILAYELTEMVHGKEEAEKALAASKAVFGAGGVSDDMPTTGIPAGALSGGSVQVADLLVAGGLAGSKGEAKRLIQQGGVAVDDEKVTDLFATVSAEKLSGGVIVKKGKKIFHRFVTES